MFASIRLVAAAAAATVTAWPAIAGTAPDVNYGEPRSVEVRYGDLDLTSQTGAASLVRRVARATAKVCGTADIRDLDARRIIHACRAETLAAVQPRIETALAAARADIRLAQTGGAPSLHVAAH